MVEGAPDWTLWNRYLPMIGRFLIVVTFLEDALRIVTQWSDQLIYLHDYRKSVSRCLLPAQSFDFEVEMANRNIYTQSQTA